MKSFKNLIEVITHFSDEQVATEHLIQLRWADNITCVHCSSERVKPLNGATKRYKCYACRKQFSATKGSIFENSPIPLQKWFAAIYVVTSHKKGISSHQLAKDISVTQKSAWFMLQRVRFALESGSFEQTGGPVQLDETYIGGKEKNKHQSKYAKEQRAKGIEDGTIKRNTGRSLETKTPVFGIMETGGKVIAQVVKDTKSKTLMPIILANVEKGTTIVTDEYNAYNKVKKHFEHQIVNHKDGEYVANGFHTNGIENFWSIFKRGIIGIYHQVSDKHLDKYIDEFEFRYNTRKCNEAERFDKMLSRCNTRLTYAQLIAK